ncbi:MAG: methyltransferase family protein [bacterium]
MMENSEHGYGMWPMVIFSIFFFTVFVASFLVPAKKREWRSLGLFEAFIIALYTEMYGFPLTIYILSSFFGIKIPFLHFKGHLWASLLGLGDEWAMGEMTIGGSVMLVGMILIGIGWWKIHRAGGDLVTDGVYRYIRHPQYLGLILIIGGMLIHWPTLPTLIMFPILLGVYVRLAKKEDADMLQQFGERYLRYKAKTPGFLPNIGKSTTKAWA